MQIIKVLEERTILGTYCNEVHWHFKENSNDLFVKYINMFLKNKQQSSGFPSNVNTEEEKNKYIREYFENEKIVLNKENIKYNSGMRSVSKLLLNSFWGKFGQTENKYQYKIITDTTEWFKMISDDAFIIQRETASKTNICIASMTTCYARLKLYRVMVTCGDSLCYTDTDSLMLIVKKNGFCPQFR